MGGVILRELIVLLLTEILSWMTWQVWAHVQVMDSKHVVCCLKGLYLLVGCNSCNSIPISPTQGSTWRWEGCHHCDGADTLHFSLLYQTWLPTIDHVGQSLPIPFGKHFFYHSLHLTLNACFLTTSVALVWNNLLSSSSESAIILKIKQWGPWNQKGWHSYPRVHSCSSCTCKTTGSHSTSCLKHACYQTLDPSPKF